MHSVYKGNCYYVEAEADVFARNLLMPESLMNELLSKYFEKQEKRDYSTPVKYNELLLDVVNCFKVPIEQAVIRLIDFGIINNKILKIKLKDNGKTWKPIQE
jgi:Zn-dependent peptidase ImmA (M78 family)